MSDLADEYKRKIIVKDDSFFRFIKENPSLLEDDANLRIAVGQGDKGIIDAVCIVRFNAVRSKDADGNSLMTAACSFEQMQALNDWGVALNARNNSGETPLIVATLRDGSGVVGENLLKMNAKIDVVDNRGMTALDHALAAPEPNFKKIMDLIKAGAQLDVESVAVKRALSQEAVMEKNATLFELNEKGDFEGLFAREWTALHAFRQFKVASQRRQVEIVEEREREQLKREAERVAMHEGISAALTIKRVPLILKNIKR